MVAVQGSFEDSKNFNGTMSTEYIVSTGIINLGN